MKRTIIAVCAAGGLALAGLTGCGEPAAETGGPAVTVETPEVADCDAEDRRKKEIPDCGRKVRGKYKEWSWVKAGKKTPPAGWTPQRG